MRAFSTVLAAALLAAAGAGCGGGDKAAPPAHRGTIPPADRSVTRPKPKPTQAAWAERVDAACKPLQERIDAVPRPTDAASLSSWVKQTLPLLRKEIAAVKAVKRSASPAQALKQQRFVASLQNLETAFEHFRSGLRSRNPTQVQTALTDASLAGTQARTYALELNVTQCGGYSSG